MNKITIEEIQGKKYTVVWHANMSENYMRSELTWLPLKNGCLINYPWGAATHIATALPALPRHPKPEHASLLYRYMAEGMQIKGRFYTRDNDWEVDFMTAHPESVIWQEDGCKSEITHATHNGERVEIAITDEAHNG